jgi:hypothetical protein
MNYLIGIWNWFAVTVYVLIILVALRLVYIYSKEESGYWCVEMPSDPKPPVIPGDLAKALWMGLAFFLISAIFTSLFEWWIGKPIAGTSIAALLLIILFFPDEIADFSGKTVYFCWGIAEKFRGGQNLCPSCQVPLQLTGNLLLPVSHSRKIRKPKGKKELRCPQCNMISYR